MGTLALAFVLATVASASDPLAEGFESPPPETRPWCYWYWISDNLTEAGITRDLEAMARVGIGAALIGNVVDPDTPPGDVRLLSERWYDCMTHAVVEAKRLGVDLGVFNGPGWSQSGGPWIARERAMRYVVSSEVRVKGPTRFEGRLPSPREPFQEIATLAFPAPRADADVARGAGVRARCSPEMASPDRLVDGDAATACPFPAGADGVGQSAVIDLELSDPFTARSLALHPGGGSFSVRCSLLASDGGDGYRSVCDFVMDRRGLSRPKYAVNVGPMLRGPCVVSFPATTACRFRLRTTLLAVEGAGSVVGSAAGEVGVPGLAEIELSGAARVDRVVEKQLGKMHPTPLPAADSYLWPRAAEPDSPDLAVAPDRIVDLSGRVGTDGALRWDVPEGDWILLRSGMTPTGAENHPTTDEGRGPECDKMNRAAIGAHFDGHMAKILARVPGGARDALTRVVIDSYEVGSQNWTDGFERTFRDAFGYDPRPWLPVLSGRIVRGAECSDRFLWDLRRHVADRIATEYVGGLRDIAHRNGLRLWLENYGHWGFPGEFLQYGGRSDDLSGEFWVRDAPPGPGSGIELRAAASAAHIYGKRRVYAEAFTSARSFRDSPSSIKALGDWAFCQGINHLVFHVCIHQPWEDRVPGVNAWFGTEFNRHNTWFDRSEGFIDSLRRCHFLLQRGASAADVAYLIGEDAPKMTGARQPELPAGYDYDYVNAEVLATRARVIGGRISIVDGPSYALLILPRQETMRPALARTIRDLVAAGASILGPAPSRSPSLQGYPGCDGEVADIARELWGDLARGGGGALARRGFGKGRVFVGEDLAGALREAGAAPAVLAPRGVLWTHRREGDAEIFFVSNQGEHPLLADLSFRVGGRAPELWDPATGARVRSAWYEEAGGRTRVPVALAPCGSAFVLFREPSRGAPVARILRDDMPVGGAGEASPVRVERGADDAPVLVAERSGRYLLARPGVGETSVEIALPAPVVFEGPWTLELPRVAGSEAVRVGLARLLSWADHPDDAVKFFSGTATYRAGITVGAERFGEGRRVLLDLGRVETVAVVRVNGRECGTLWTGPYVADITAAARPGANALEIEVTNTWWNRLVGDARVSPERRVTFTTAPPRAPRTKLLPAGLLGPVTLRGSESRGL